MLKFNSRYFVLTLLLLAIEILIAKFAHDRIIRPYVGDFLVVILIYCFVKSFIQSHVLPIALFVLIFSYAIETLQYFKIVNILGLEDSKIAKVIMGTSFGWIDLVAYTLGIAFVLYAEKVIADRRSLRETINSSKAVRKVSPTTRY